MRSVLFGFRFVHLIVVAVGLILLAASSFRNALDYTATQAQVLRVEERCVPTGAPMGAATNCEEARLRFRGKRLRHYTAVHVSYTSPADGRVHNGVLIPIGRKAVEAAKLRPGDRWKILAHDDKPEDIKAE
jgi:hypothetical protein